MATRAVRLALAACWLLVSSCGSSAGEPPPDRELRLLFIGNSLTYANDLPALVRELGRSDPSRAVVVSSVTYGAYSLEDHWNRGEAQQAIASGQWDYVILQQGPSALPESRVLLIDYVTRFAEEIRRAGARPAIYMVWPPLNREPEWDAVTESYAAAARRGRRPPPPRGRGHPGSARRERRAPALRYGRLPSRAPAPTWRPW